MNATLMQNEEKYKAYVIEKAKRYTSNKWWGSINHHAIKRWINQFPENNLVPYLLLDNLNIITDTQIMASLVAILERIKSNIFCGNAELTDDKLFMLWEEHINHSLFIAAHEARDSISSAPIVVRKLRDILPASIFHLSTAETLCSDLFKYEIEYVYFVDDFIGTGKQMNDYLKHKFICTNQRCPSTKQEICTIKDIMSHWSNVRFNIITIAQHIKGQNFLEKEFPVLGFLTSNMLDDEYNLLSDWCSIYIDKAYINDVKKAIDDFRTKHVVDNLYSLNLSFGFDHGFPNNALEVFWWPRTDWKPLIARND